ncbi:MAG: imidazole glycerol phosphate synthase subunit HisH [Gammaproteobacteria bacterium]
MNTTIAIIDYGMGNLRSVSKALEHVADHDARVEITSDPEKVLAADRVVFPGQGAARDCMAGLKDAGLEQAVRETSCSKPFLGICMGLQVLIDHSEENNGTDCLGLYRGRVKRFANGVAGQGLRIPHMGWNQVEQTQHHPLWADVPQHSRFYFDHSYYLEPSDVGLTAGATEYGVRFAAAIARDNVFAIQCHPEKSARTGLTLLANFARWDGVA